MDVEGGRGEGGRGGGASLVVEEMVLGDNVGLTAPPAICTAQAVRLEGGQRPYIRETMHSALNL